MFVCVRVNSLYRINEKLCVRTGDAYSFVCMRILPFVPIECDVVLPLVKNRLLSMSLLIMETPNTLSKKNPKLLENMAKIIRHL